MRKKNLKFQDEKWANDFIRLVKKGYFIEIICNIKGVKPKTFKQWEKKADADDEKYVDFIGRVRRAEAMVEAKMTDVVVSDALAGNTKTVMKYMEKRFKDRWGKTQDINLSQDEDFVYEIVTATPEQIQKQREEEKKILEKARG